jgi:hypothetical protein
MPQDSRRFVGASIAAPRRTRVAAERLSATHLTEVLARIHCNAVLTDLEMQVRRAAAARAADAGDRLAALERRRRLP